ncbi:YjbH domain-containing protein [Robbsia sp. KACC 23696]|uniref:YjbH domain-containing protein n=1 Tax=Robbsia sp. KACC 23696 TaxID=3149231 RepID=UPI00325AF184
MKAWSQVSATIDQSTYLGDWLVQRHIEEAGFDSNAATNRAPAPLYTRALIWTRPLDRLIQEARWRALLTQIKYRPGTRRIKARVRDGLYARLSAMEPTGRLPVRSGDGRWLQANPQQDPKLSPGDTVTVPLRPNTVSIILEDGAICTVPYRADAEASYYIQACTPRIRADIAWVAQPDATVQKVGIGLWNAQKQTPVAPGAWIWAPSRRSGWPEQVSDRIAAFLATQPPSGIRTPHAAVTQADDAEVGSDNATAVDATSIRPDVVNSASGNARRPAPVSSSQQNPAAAGALSSNGGGTQRAAAPMAASDVAATTDARALTQSATPDELIKPNVSDANLARANRWAKDRDDDLQVTSNDFGSEGLLQTPSARMSPAGSASISFTDVNPYQRVNIMMNPLDWLEFGFRYTNIQNHLYGAEALSGDQSYKDKSIDAKVRLWKESAFVPQVALGMMDIGGTGLFSSEYLVASKRTGGFDWSLGLGWGYLGSRGDLSNPFSVFSSKFDTRPNGNGASTAGGIGKSFFRGRTALFGGVQYQFPTIPLIVKLEYDGNDYKKEPFGYDANAKLPINVGLVYRATRNLDLSVGFERGNRFMFGATLHGNLSNLGTRKVSAAAPLPVSPQRPAPDAPAPDWRKTVADVQAQTGWKVLDIQSHGQTLVIVFDSPQAFYRRRLLDQIATVLHRDAPADIDTFRIVTVLQGQTMRSYTVRRTAWVQSKTQAVPVTDQTPTILEGAPPPNAQVDESPALYKAPIQRFYYAFGPGYSQSLGGPNGFVLYSISAQANAAFRLTQSTWLAGGLSYRLFDNYSNFTYDAPSSLPHVRTEARHYMTTSRLTIPYLQMTHIGKLTANQYYSLYGGLLEPMFAGVGAEWLWRPSNSPLAVGVDVNEVKQRGYNDDFSMRSYQTFTGHLTAYWDTGWNDVLVKASVGQYLAKDKGITLDISRRFRNGVLIGAYATKTNITSAQFGEGSFDKGVYVQIPFDALLSRSTGGIANLNWEPLTRDGGAKLDRQFQLYDLTDERSPKNLWYQPGADVNRQ